MHLPIFHTAWLVLKVISQKFSRRYIVYASDKQQTFQSNKGNKHSGSFWIQDVSSVFLASATVFVGLNQYCQVNKFYRDLGLSVWFQTSQL